MTIMDKHIPLSVCVDGQTVYPPGWMFVVGLALGGAAWAVEECDKPEFKERIKNWQHEQKVLQKEQQCCSLEESLRVAKADLAKLKEESCV